MKKTKYKKIEKPMTEQIRDLIDEVNQIKGKQYTVKANLSLFILIVDELKDPDDPKIRIIGIFDTKKHAWQHAKAEGYLVGPRKDSGVTVTPLNYYRDSK